jgi:predicted small integral membrane protein
MLERISKIALVASVALFLGIVALNNVIDYGSNFDFVKHVLSMDTTFSGNKLKGRALTEPAIHHVFYAGIIAWEWIGTFSIGGSALYLWMRRRAPAAEFDRAKSPAIASLTLNMLLWFTAFITVGGEWFVMWQSQIWNGQTAAFRMFACIGIILLFLKTPDSELSPASKA